MAPATADLSISSCMQTRVNYRVCVITYVEENAETGLPLAKLDLLGQVPQLQELLLDALLLVASVH